MSVLPKPLSFSTDDMLVEAIKNASLFDGDARRDVCPLVASIAPLEPFVGPVFVAPARFLGRGLFDVPDYFADASEDEITSLIFAYADECSRGIDDLVAYDFETGRVATLLRRAWGLDAPGAFYDCFHFNDSKLRVALDVGSWLKTGGAPALAIINLRQAAIEILLRDVHGLIAASVDAAEIIKRRLGRFIRVPPIFVDKDFLL